MFPQLIMQKSELVSGLRPPTSYYCPTSVTALGDLYVLSLVYI